MREQHSSSIALRQAEWEAYRRQRTMTISLLTSGLFLLLTLLFLPNILASETPNYWSFALTIPVALIGITSALLALRNQTTAGAHLLLGTILLLSLGAPIVGRGQGVSIGILVALLGVGIATNTLPRPQITRGIWLSVATGVLVIVVDQFVPDFGLESNPVYTIVAASILSVIFIIISAQRFNTFTLRTKLIVAFAIVTILPLLILGLYNNFVAKQTATRDTQERLGELSRLVAQQYDAFINQELNQIRVDAKQITVFEYLNLFESRRSGSAEETRAMQSLITFKRREPVFINSYAILDRNGINALSTTIDDLGRDESTNDYFKIPLGDNEAYSSNVLFAGGHDAKTSASIYFSAPITDAAGNPLGVLRVEFNAAILQYLVSGVAPDDPSIIVSLLEGNSLLRLADSGDSQRLFTTFKNYAELEVAALQAQGKIPNGTPMEIMSESDPAVVAGIDNLNQQPFFNSTSPTLGIEYVNTGIGLVTQPWIVLVSEASTTTLQAERTQARNIIFISILLGAFAILLGYGASGLLATPLISLTRVAEQISAGNISAQAQISTEDEVGALAESLNRMTGELRQTLTTLEERVAERTTDLEIARQQSEKRAGELTAVGEISKLISSEQKLETLLPLIARLVSERFDFYHTGIFLLDETGEFAVLQAANSEGGRRMLERGHRLEVGESGIVGYAARYGTPRIALDVGQDAVFFNNPDLPNTRSEMGLPLIARGRTLGVLDVQSDKPGAFTNTDISTLSILSDQIAIAIENARLFQQTQQALNDMEALYRQNIKQGWAAFSREESLVGYQHSAGGSRKLTKPVETDEIRDAINRGSTQVMQPDENSQDSYIVVPVKLRGQIIGTLKVQAPSKNRIWTSDEINLAGAVSERLSLALENARLIQESQKQVIKEQTISEVTSKIGASIDLKSVLQTAVEELGRAMPGSEVQIRFDSNGKGQEDRHV